MTDKTITNDIQLDEYCAMCADDILSEESDRDSAMDMAHEYADGSQYVIYYWRAHALCAGCNTDRGESFLEDTGHPDGATYDQLATLIAYGEIYSRIAEIIDARQ